MEEPMTNQDFGRGSSTGARDGGGRTASKGKTASDAYSKASDMAQDAAEKAKQAASQTASAVTRQVKELLDHQVENGAEMVGHFATSAKRAADDLDLNAPQLAGLVRTFADTVESYSDELRGQSVDQLMRAASDLTRRQPALVFGLAALAGFFVFRTLKNIPPVPSPSIQPTYEGHRHGASEFHGT
jgi:ABC-type transporter Mla subunit MlaD